MPQLHANQIQWAAPEAQKVKLAKPDYTPVAEGLQRLGRAAQEFSEYQQQIDDVEAKTLMDEAVSSGLVDLEKYQPTDNNYEPAMEKFRNDLNTLYNSFDEPTRNRFMRNDPAYFDKQQLRADAIVFEKQQAFAVKKAQDLIPLLSSNVTEGKETYESQRLLLDSMVSNMDNVTAEELITTFDRQVQIGNINNLILSGRYSDAVKLLEDPKSSDLLTPQERTDMKLSIDKTMKEEAKNKAELKKKITDDINDQLENGLVTTLLYALDREDDAYAKIVKGLDDPEYGIKLTDDEGNVYATVQTKNIPVMIRRDAIKKAMTYLPGSVTYRANTLRANQLAKNFIDTYNAAQGNRTSGEIYNDIYDFVKGPDFIYLEKGDQDKLYDIVYGEVARYNEQVLPYENIRNENLLYGGFAEYSGPSPQRVVRGYTFGSKAGGTIQAPKNQLSTLEKAMSTGQSVLPMVPVSLNKTTSFDNKQVGFRQLTEVLRDNYKKTTKREVLPGSQLEFLMDVYAAALSYTPEERRDVGLGNATDSQIGLTYARMKGMLERAGTTDSIIGTNMTPQQADEIRKGIFNSFYEMLLNGARPVLSQEQQDYKKEYYNSVVEGSYGLGGAPFSFTKKENRMSEKTAIYSTPMTNRWNQQLEKYNKGDK